MPREWLVTNGLGGYASATISGAITRRYHGFLIAALPPPLGRTVVLNDLDVAFERADGTVANLREHGRFVDFTLKMRLPSWRHEIDGVVIEKSVVLPSGHNIVHVSFRLIGEGGPVRLRLRPFINFRALDGATFTADGGSRRECCFKLEAQRGYDSKGWLWSPGYFTGEVRDGRSLTFVAATEPWQTILALTPDDALAFENERRRRLVSMAAAPLQTGLGAELVLAADTFVITPVGRIADVARARAEGDEVGPSSPATTGLPTGVATR